MFQAKEKKWIEVERIVVTYARKDLDLREKLTNIKYICDDPSSKRKITTVIEENESLQKRLETQQKEIEELKGQLTMNTEANPYDFGDDFLQDGGSQRIATFMPGGSKKNKTFLRNLPKFDNDLQRK